MWTTIPFASLPSQCWTLYRSCGATLSMGSGRNQELLMSMRRGKGSQGTPRGTGGASHRRKGRPTTATSWACGGFGSQIRQSAHSHGLHGGVQIWYIAEERSPAGAVIAHCQARIDVTGTCMVEPSNGRFVPLPELIISVNDWGIVDARPWMVLLLVLRKHIWVARTAMPGRLGPLVPRPWPGAKSLLAHWGRQIVARAFWSPQSVRSPCSGSIHGGSGKMPCRTTPKPSGGHGICPSGKGSSLRCTSGFGSCAGCPTRSSSWCTMGRTRPTSVSWRLICCCSCPTSPTGGAVCRRDNPKERPADRTAAQPLSPESWSGGHTRKKRSGFVTAWLTSS